MLTTDAINDFKDFIDNIIAYAKVTVNGVSEKKVIHRRERLKDGRVAVYVQITPQGKRNSHSAEGAALQQEQQIVG